MTQNAFAMLGQGGELSRPESLEQLLSGVALLLPMLDAIPNAAIFIKDIAARYVLANRTLVQRCGLKQLQPLLGKTSAEVFPAQWGRAIPSRIARCWNRGWCLKTSWSCTCTGLGNLAGA